MQEVAVSALRQADWPRSPAKLRAWLFQIATRRVADHFRQKERHSVVIADDDAVTEAGTRDAGGWRWLAAVEDRQAVTTALGRLDEAEQELLRLRYTERCSIRTIAVELGTTERSVEYRLSAARRRLRTALGPREASDD